MYLVAPYKIDEVEQRYTFKGAKAVCLRSEKEPTLKGKNLLPMGVNSFLLK